MCHSSTHSLHQECLQEEHSTGNIKIFLQSEQTVSGMESDKLLTDLRSTMVWVRLANGARVGSVVVAAIVVIFVRSVFGASSEKAE